MSTRKVKLFSTAGTSGKKDFESRATTVEELRKELKDLMGNDLSSMSIKEGTTKKELDTFTELPEGDLKLFILPAKVSSGKK